MPPYLSLIANWLPVIRRPPTQPWPPHHFDIAYESTWITTHAPVRKLPVDEQEQSAVVVTSLEEALPLTPTNVAVRGLRTAYRWTWYAPYPSGAVRYGYYERAWTWGQLAIGWPMDDKAQPRFRFKIGGRS